MKKLFRIPGNGLDKYRQSQLNVMAIIIALDPAIPRTVYNGDYSEKYVFKLLEKYSNN